MNITNFAYGTEKMINPMEVGTVHHLQKKLRHLPVFLQKKIVLSAAKRASKMGFVVEPYAFFLIYDLPDPAKAQPDLPDGFVPVKSRIFEGAPEKYYGIAAIFRVHTSVFWGSRAEFYTIAKNKATGLTSWIILDYISDTISYDDKKGLRSPEAEYAVVTTTCEAEFIADIKKRDAENRLICQASLAHPKMRPLDETLWIDGNTSIAYGKTTGSDSGDLFSLTFFPDEMKQAWDIPLKDVKIAKVGWLPEIFGGKLDRAVCFPFAQHMLSDSPGNRTHYGSKSALARAAKSVDFSRLKSLAQK